MFFRGIPAGFLSLPLLLAAPPLTRIQDVLYKADGTRFNGIAIVTWKTFEASDTSNITTQSLTVRIVEGNLRVDLVPNGGTTPPAPYVVKYNSDGKAQFEENWVVPASATPVRVRDVRVAARPAPVEGGGVAGPIEESDVTGLVADLQARPVKGPAFSPSRAAYINGSGALEAVTGDPADCVRVDGTSGPCGSTEGMPGFIDLETPAGVVDGSNAVFALGATPSPSSSLALYRNGILQKFDQDFQLTTNQVSFVTAAVPQPGDTLLASYRTGTAAAGELTAAGPEVICSAGGGTTSSVVLTPLGTCVIPAGSLRAGDRLEIRFDYSHEGTDSAYAVSLRYGLTTVFTRGIPAWEPLVTGRAEAAVYESGVQLGAQTWGSVLSQSGSVVAGSEGLGMNIPVTLSAAMAQETGDSVTLRNFAVIRYSK